MFVCLISAIITTSSANFKFLFHFFHTLSRAQKCNFGCISNNFPKISKSQKSPLRGKFFIFHFFSQKFFGWTRFNIFPTILAQKTKIEKFEIFPKISKSQKSPPRGKFFIFHFFAKIFWLDTFQHISDHLSPKNENRKFEIFRLVPKGKFFILHFFAKIFGWTRFNIFPTI